MKLLFSMILSFTMTFSYDLPYELPQHGFIQQDAIVPFADVLVWKYKVINNRLNKRLYNSSTKEWIGDWILA